MLLKLIDRSPDIMKLRNEGYEVSINGAYLLITNIPYVNKAKEICYGTLVSEVSIAQGKAVKPRTHVSHFAGDLPCTKEGVVIESIRNSSRSKTLGGVEIDHTFSNKPPNGYTDYYHKMTQYIAIISNPAKAIDKSVTAQTFKVVEDEGEDSSLHYVDTNSSRVEIDNISRKLMGLKIGIIGLGGTGSYILDLVAKTLVEEIHLFDRDYFLQHNAFRSPGAPSLKMLNGRKKRKVSYLERIYSKMHKGIFVHPVHIDEDNLLLLQDLDFIFICIDKSAPKQFISAYLIKKKIPFIDVGMGIDLINNALEGMLRVTLCTPKFKDSIEKKKRVSFADADEDDDYSTNIQIAELNLINAGLAVLKWKKHFGIYHDQEDEHNITFTISLNSILNEDHDV